jgi:hypothetical protein
LTLSPAILDTIWTDTDADSEDSDDWDHLAEYSCTVSASPPALDARAMAEDFSEGRLETLVGSPQKELAGTQNAYVSYLVTTKVRHGYALTTHHSPLTTHHSSLTTHHHGAT